MQELDKDVPEQVVSFQNEEMSFNISSNGMEIKKVELKKYLDRENKHIVLGNPGEGGLFGTSILGDNDNKKLKFNIDVVNNTTFQGTAVTQEGIKITKTIEVSPLNLFFKIKNRGGEHTTELFWPFFSYQRKNEIKPRRVRS